MKYSSNDIILQSEGDNNTPAEVMNGENAIEKIQSVDSCLQSANQCFATIGESIDIICNAFVSWKEIDLQMHQVEVQFDYLSKQLDINLEMYKARAPIVGKQLDNVSRAMEKILDKVLEMDAVSEMEMNMKMKYMEMVDNYMNNLSSMMAKLL